MRFAVLATDFDGTLADNGVVPDSALGALRELRAAGRRTVLVTGRRISELEGVFPRLDLFDRVVAENGLVLMDPKNGARRQLAASPPDALIEALHRYAVAPFDVGDSIIATWRPNEGRALEAIRATGLEYQVIFNHDAVMLVPSGHNKATGLRAALDELERGVHSTIAIGDAENDHAFLAAAELGIAVSTATGSLRAEAAFVTHGGPGEGVAEVARLALHHEDVLEAACARRQSLRIGQAGCAHATIPASGPVLLVSGPSHGGKSTATGSLLVELTSRGYQCCVLDPEGDYSHALPHSVVVDARDTGALETVANELMHPARSVVCKMLHIASTDRPAFFGAAMQSLVRQREDRGAPHWIVVDEAHHMLYAPLRPASGCAALRSFILVSVYPEHIARETLRAVTHLLAVGPSPHHTVVAFSRAAGREAPSNLGTLRPARYQAIFWDVKRADAQVIDLGEIAPCAPRHARKYAEGDLGEARSFVFRGPDGSLYVRARNLQAFVALASAVDDRVWLFHLLRGDYQRWMREGVGDASLADELASIAASGMTAADSRSAIAAAIERKYAPPA